jgi:stearoyl-CoA desaturase (Delta-9 desaturase)
VGKFHSQGFRAMEIVLGLSLFFVGYCINMFYISVLYHRALTHKAIILGPKMSRWLALTGVWFTGLDPKTWACMHRLHHMHSDTHKDPHSPTQLGVMGVWIGQYKAYISIQERLLNSDPEMSSVVADIPFGVSWSNQRKYLTWLPYILHGLLGLFLWIHFQSLWVGGGYFLGIMSHPIQGWMVNALAHRFGSRNFETNDHSTNNHFVGLLVFGEGYQNNHHKYPKRAKFSHRWFEVDLGYAMCVLAEILGLVKIVRASGQD